MACFSPSTPHSGTPADLPPCPPRAQNRLLRASRPELPGLVRNGPDLRVDMAAGSFEPPREQEKRPFESLPAVPYRAQLGARR